MLGPKKGKKERGGGRMSLFLAPLPEKGPFWAVAGCGCAYFSQEKKLEKKKKANAHHFPVKCWKVRPGFMCQLAKLAREKSAFFVSFLHLRRLERKTCFWLLFPTRRRERKEKTFFGENIKEFGGILAYDGGGVAIFRRIQLFLPPLPLFLSPAYTLWEKKELKRGGR